MARAFIKHALENPPLGLSSEIESIYILGGRLSKSIRDAENLIAASREDAGVYPLDGNAAVPRLTLGGILPLERTLVYLKGLRNVQH